MPRRKQIGGALEVGEVKQFVDASYEPNKGQTNQIGSYVLDKELSTRKAKVYHDPSSGKTVVTNRGTTGTASDWANNARYLMGSYGKTDRMKQAEKVQKAAIQKYGKVDTNVGHSQGGIITRKLNEKGLTGEVINLNPASKGEKQQKNEFVIRSATDPVSMLHQGKKRTTTTKGGVNLLAEHSANILDRLNPTQIIGVGSLSMTERNRYRPHATDKKGRGGGEISNVLSNSDIDAYMEAFDIKDYHGCFVKDELPDLNHGFYVINLNGQSHWTCLLKDVEKDGSTQYLYFDSFGFPAPVEVEKAILRDTMGKSATYYSMENQLQDIDHTSCGFYVIAFIKFLHNKKDKKKAYKKFIEKFTVDPSRNDQILEKILGR